jgi:hypothetical protein
MFVRRLAIVAGTAAAAVALSTGSAFAHECYFTNPNPHADAGRSQTPAFMSFYDMAFAETEGALCDDGIAVVADALGITPDTLINVRGMMAGPTEGNKAIQHLNFGLIDDKLMGRAFGACPDA